jgi:hypothetical protein
MRSLLSLTLFAPLLYSQPITFNRQIAPILYNNCSSCHRPGEAAPFSLLSYQDAKSKGPLIAAVTASRVMPPWKADPASYPYRDEHRLKDAEIDLLKQWVKAGMPEGDGPKPAAPKFNSGWQLGEPDLIVEMPAGYKVPADGPDIYRNIALPLGLTEEKWITAIDMKPTARSVVHHVLYFGDPTGKVHEHPQDGEQPGFSGMRAGNATVPLGGPEGLALNLAKGSDLVIQYHFHPTGKPETERSVVGLYFAKQAPERRLFSIQMPPLYSLFAGLKIPAGEQDYVVRDSYTLPADIDAVGVGAHAHYLGKKLKMTATLPNGEIKTLLSIGDWDFAWQDRYFFKDFVSLPRGTRLDAEVHWDNSASNPHNPSNPPIPITWGEQSKDEMGSVSLIAVPRVMSDYAALVREQRGRTQNAAMERLKAEPGFLLKLRDLMNR